MQNSKALSIFLVLLIAIAPSCSMFSSSRQTVTIRASDPAAEIYVDGKMVGVGAVTTRLDKDSSHSVMARVDDRTGVAHIDNKVSGTGVLDIVGGFFLLFPWLGILGPGFKKLDADYVDVAIPPAAQN